MIDIIKPGDPRFNGRGAPQQPVDPRPIVAVLIPSMDMVHADFMMSLIAMLWHANNYARTMTLNFKGSSISLSRNMLVQSALDIPAHMAPDYALFIDTDMTFPMEAMGHLLKHQRAIIGATYARRKEPFDALGRLKHVPGRDLAAGGVHEAEALPGGFLMVKMSVFRQLKRPWFFETYDYEAQPPFASEDYGFCKKAREGGISLWCDLDLSTHMGHIGQHAVKIPPLRGAQVEPVEEMVDG